MEGSSDYKDYCNGDDQALARLIRDYKDGLIFYLRTFTGDIHTAEDLAEDTFVKLAVKKPRYNGSASFKTWLYRIAGNLAVDWRRKNRGRTVPLETCEDLPADEISQEQAFIREEERIAVHHAMRTLPEESQRILWLVYFEGYSVKDAGALMGKSAHAAETTIYRARQRLKEALSLEERKPDENSGRDDPGCACTTG
ncbi:MAG: sigma-70 family RNA polymerase sigma factor [Lachnospiraceae bacterium]|nr:sigma-70 family RNA polymerase sigma factor [Lachnospiraceae bacterium]